MSAVGCDWGCCVQEAGWTVLMAACERGDMDIVTLLLAAPGVDVNAAYVSCVSGETPACRYELRCWEVSQDGWVRVRVSVEVDCVGGGL